MYTLMILYTWMVIATNSLRKLFNLPNISASRSMYIMSRSKDVFFVMVYMITIIVFLLTVLSLGRRAFGLFQLIDLRRPMKVFTAHGIGCVANFVYDGAVGSGALLYWSLFGVYGVTCPEIPMTNTMKTNFSSILTSDLLRRCRQPILLD
uniref:G protein-coupled receptor n=1 Tax=Ascaris lumbricoides TaxID=6252 RepID=A0A0M3HGM9_ASCLU